MALIQFSFFCFVLYCYAFVQYCNVTTLQYDAMHTFAGVLNNPHYLSLPFLKNYCVSGFWTLSTTGTDVHGIIPTSVITMDTK